MTNARKPVCIGTVVFFATMTALAPRSRAAEPPASAGVPTAPSFGEPGPPRLGDSEHFTIDPIADGLFVAGGTAFDLLLTAILSTGEIVPTAPGDYHKLLSIDRSAVTQTIDPNAAKYSTYGLWAAYGFAILDPIISGARNGRRAFLVDAIMYAESIAITGAFTEVTKIGVRRPRPIDYKNCGGKDQATTPGCDSTDLQLSFFSGHASATATIGATATYLSFVRNGWHSPRPWITLGVGVALTTFVSYERVRSGEHFPTDVIMGSLAGAGIGVLVPHFHRRPHLHQNELEAPSVIVGYAPTVGGGGEMTVMWRF